MNDFLNKIKNLIFREKAICIKCKYCNDLGYNLECLKFENPITLHPRTGEEVRRDIDYESIFVETCKKHPLCKTINKNGICLNFRNK